MNPTLLISLGVLALTASALSAETLHIYIGTQTTGDSTSKGIYLSSIDLGTGELADPELLIEAGSPNFLEISPSGKHLYAIGRTGGKGSAFSFDISPGTGALTKTAEHPCGKGPCHVTVSPDGRSVLAADYGGGSALSYPVDSAGVLGVAASVIKFTGSGADPKRQKAPHCHSAMVSPDGKFAYFADLGTDRIMTYSLANETAELTASDPAFAKLHPAAGPRHMVFAPDNETVYVINELDSTMSVFSQDATTGALTEKQTISTLPADFKGRSKCAEVRVHPSGRFVYGSNRGFGSIVVFQVDAESGELSHVEQETEDIAWPRNFNLTPDGKWCLVANTNGNNIRVFAVDEKTGALEATSHKIQVGKPMCIRFLAL